MEYNDFYAKIKLILLSYKKLLPEETILKRAELLDVLDAKIICGEDQPDEDIQFAFGSDMMSDVLAFTKHDVVLLTGQVNNHVLRTAEMMDIQSIIFVRGKEPSEEIVEMAKDMDMILMATKLPMFTACGILYENGIKGGMRNG